MHYEFNLVKPRNEVRTAAALTPYRAVIIINGAHAGPVFQGIGAISGGGGNSRLLLRIAAWRPGLQAGEETPRHLPGNVGGTR
jgi:hypothetical protein